MKSRTEYDAAGRTEFLRFGQLGVSLSEDTVDVGKRVYEEATGEMATTIDQVIMGCLLYLAVLE